VKAKFDQRIDAVENVPRHHANQTRPRVRVRATMAAQTTIRSRRQRHARKVVGVFAVKQRKSRRCEPALVLVSRERRHQQALNAQRSAHAALSLMLACANAARKPAPVVLRRTIRALTRTSAWNGKQNQSQ